MYNCTPSMAWFGYINATILTIFFTEFWKFVSKYNRQSYLKSAFFLDIIHNWSQRVIFSYFRCLSFSKDDFDLPQNLKICKNIIQKYLFISFPFLIFCLKCFNRIGKLTLNKRKKKKKKRGKLKKLSSKNSFLK